MSKVSLSSQIAAVEVVISGRSATFSGSKRDLHRDHMLAALRSLQFLQRHEAAIRALAEKRRTGGDRT